MNVNPGPVSQVQGHFKTMKKSILIIALLLMIASPTVYADENKENTEKIPEQINISTQNFTEIFPISLPWDLLYLMDLVKTDPIAPDVNMQVSAVPAAFGMEEKKINFRIDLSRYENQMAIFRSLQLMSFSVSLALITRNFIG